MHQIRLLPSGSQTWYRHIIDSSPSHFIYCSTLASYQHSALSDSGFRLERLIAAHDRTITGISWSQSNPQFYVTAGLDYTLKRWNCESTDENAVNTFVIGNQSAPPLAIDYSPHDPGLIAVLLKPGTVYFWDIQLNQLDEVEGMRAGQVTAIKWNYGGLGGSGAPKLAAAHSDGAIHIYDVHSRSIARIASQGATEKNATDRGDITDLLWDPLSNQYLLAIYSGGFMCLFDTETGEIIQEFQKQAFDISMAAFIRSAPGDFLSVNHRTGVIQVWNVSQPNPKEFIRLPGRKCGITAIKPLSGQNKFLLSFSDGAAGVLDWLTKRMEYLTQPAHSETIFDCQFKPNNANQLATASYDGTVKIWDSLKMSCLQELKGQDGVIYAIAWSTSQTAEGSEELVSASSNGEVYLWNARTGAILQRFHHHSKPIYRLSWNRLDADMIASSSSDGYCCIFKRDGSLVKKLKHPTSVYGCDFHPFQKNLIATGAHDALVRVFDLNSTSNKPICEFAGHSARVFNTVWSPLLPDRVASGSDDRTIRIWSINNPQAPPIVLSGHRHNVRALAWSHEIPWLVLSGSWDGSIRLWDIRHARCLHVIEDHHADVYGLVAHPDRPFVFASSSRDTSLRLWSLEDSLAARLKTQAVINHGQLSGAHLCDAKSAMAVDGGSEVKLSGKASSLLAARLKGLEKDKGGELLAYAWLFDYFSGTPGVKELWALIYSMVHNKSSFAANGNLSEAAQATSLPSLTGSSSADSDSGSANSNGNSVTSIPSVAQIQTFSQLASSSSSVIQNAPVLALPDVASYVLHNARTLTSAKMNGIIGLGKRSDRLESAADAYLKLGSLKEYCDLQWELGNYERALAVAPGVSIVYWKHLALKFANQLAEQCDATAIPYFAASGEIGKLVDFQLKLKDFQSALWSAVGDSQAAFPRYPPISEEDLKRDSASRLAVSIDGSDRQPVPITPLIRRVVEFQSAQLFNRGAPVQAAAAFLAAGDAERAVYQLYAGNEILLAFAVCRVLRLTHVDYIYRSLAHYCESLDLWDEGIQALAHLQDPKDEFILFASRYPGPPDVKAKFYLKCGIRSPEAFQSSVEALIRDGKRADTLVALVAAGLYERAISVGSDYLRELLTQPAWSLEEFGALIRPLNSIPAAQLPGDSKSLLLTYSFYYAAQVAQTRSYHRFVLTALEAFHQSLQRCPASFQFPVALSVVRLQESSVMLKLDPVKALQILNSSVVANDAKLKNAVLALKKLADSAISSAQLTAFSTANSSSASVESKHRIVPVGSQLPSVNSRRAVNHSCLTKQLLEGRRIVLDETDRSAIASENEALMWRICTPFVPNGSGKKVNQFAVESGIIAAPNKA